jgi:nucleoside-diphosphate-sugar epimerase
LHWAIPQNSLDSDVFQGATVLITGATGFVGSHTVEAFARRGCRIRAVVRRTSRIDHLASLGAEAVTAPLDDADALREAVRGASAVVHLAALTRAENEAAFDRVNREATSLLASVAVEAGVERLVYLSSLAAVGPATRDRPVCRDTAARPLTAYGRSKLAGERAWREIGGPAATILRAPAVYGPRDRDVYHFFRMARFGILPVPTGVERWLQMVHVADLAESVAAAALAESAHGVYHIAESRAYTWKEMCRLVAAAVGSRARFVPVPPAVIAAAGAFSETASRIVRRPGIFDRDKAREMLAPGWLCETEAAAADFGFRARIALAEGFAETARWYRAAGML